MRAVDVSQMRHAQPCINNTNKRQAWHWDANDESILHIYTSIKEIEIELAS